MLKRVLIGLGLATVVVAVGLYGRHLWVTRHVVYVGVPTSVNQYDDDEPVTTTLHEYDRRSPISSYQTTGRSISFSFARRLYTFRGNARGGPQRSISISVDRTTLAGIDTMSEWAKLDQPYMPASNAYVLLSLRSHLEIEVHSGQSGPTEDIGIKRALERKPIAPFARFCGVTWYLDREINDWKTLGRKVVTASTPGPAFGVGETVIGIFNNSEIDGRSASIYCNAGGGDCTVNSKFEGWQMSFEIDRARFCDWPEEQERIRSFLADHVVERTRRRDQ